jgi:lipoprotein-anchoring transpeptidase ErfK/SrfK
MYLNKPTYLIHTAAGASRLGGKSSYGCVRMYERDIAKLYPIIPIKTKVKIIDQPVTSKPELYKYCSRRLKML